MPGPLIEIVNGLDRRIVTAAVRQCLLTLLKTEGSAKPVTLLITNSEEMRRLNREMRGIDQATDVLTFPAPDQAPVLGDIALSIEFATLQAKRRKVRLQDEMAMLAVHGGLHLLGWNDETDDERQKMVEKMNEVMTLCGLPTDDHWESLPHGEDE
ncbi:MAG: rRNA maturation RNase YbeY [Fimbriimonadaceae bacterium]|jgi:probable rRNA maturation factor|nr:rRNA maturation RNase YbeY [Fimbriimonadaceae bacterium]